MRIVKGKIYYGWYVLGAVSGISFANTATTIGILTIFILPLTDEFGWTRTEISIVTSIGALLGAAMSPFSGGLTDKWGARIPLGIGAVLIIIALLNLAAVNTLLWFSLAFILARLADQGLVLGTVQLAVAKWFDRYRGRAMSVLILASSAGGVLLPPLVQFVISTYGWRSAWLTLAGVMIVLGLIPVLAVVRRQPEDMGIGIDGLHPEVLTRQAPGIENPETSGNESGWTLKKSLKTNSLWLLTGTAFLLGIGNTGIALHLVPYLIGSGISSTAAVGAVSIHFFSSAASTLAWGYLADKFSRHRLLMIALLVKISGMALLLHIDTLIEAYVFSITQGVAEAAVRTLIIFLLADYFGRKNLGSIFGLNRMAQIAGFALGPIVAGLVFDATGSYATAFVSFLVLTAFAILLLALARAPSHPKAASPS